MKKIKPIPVHGVLRCRRLEVVGGRFHKTRILATVQDDDALVVVTDKFENRSIELRANRDSEIILLDDGVQRLRLQLDESKNASITIGDGESRIRFKINVDAFGGVQVQGSATENRHAAKIHNGSGTPEAEYEGRKVL